MFLLYVFPAVCAAIVLLILGLCRAASDGDELAREHVEEMRLRAERQERVSRTRLNGIGVPTGNVVAFPARPPVCLDVETSFLTPHETLVQYRERVDHDGPGAA